MNVPIELSYTIIWGTDSMDLKYMNAFKVFADAGGNPNYEKELLK